tara:strand:+ start:342 stop:1037 length:696 start_codon:yes stop_codon:yes gene_type:complete
MIIEIDNREPTLIKEFFNKKMLESKFFTIVFKNLDQGDYIIKDINNNIIIIIERKTINDLLSSVKDNRYKEQCDRFLQLNIQSNKIYYIIEGEYNNYDSNSPEYKTIYSCLYSLSYTKEFSLLFTQSIRETPLIIYEFLYRFSENKISSNNKLNLIKKNVITTENIDLYMLNLVPGVGLTTSKNILEVYDNSILNLMLNLKNDNKLLDNIKINNKKLSKKIVSNINLYLLK